MKWTFYVSESARTCACVASTNDSFSTTFATLEEMWAFVLRASPNSVVRLAAGEEPPVPLPTTTPRGRVAVAKTFFLGSADHLPELLDVELDIAASPDVREYYASAMSAQFHGHDTTRVALADLTARVIRHFPDLIESIKCVVRDYRQNMHATILEVLAWCGDAKFAAVLDRSGGKSYEALVDLVEKRFVDGMRDYVQWWREAYATVFSDARVAWLVRLAFSSSAHLPWNAAVVAQYLDACDVKVRESDVTVRSSTEFAVHVAILNALSASRANVKRAVSELRAGATVAALTSICGTLHAALTLLDEEGAGIDGDEKEARVWSTHKVRVLSLRGANGTGKTRYITRQVQWLAVFRPHIIDAILLGVVEDAPLPTQAFACDNLLVVYDDAKFDRGDPQNTTLGRLIAARKEVHKITSIVASSHYCCALEVFVDTPAQYMEMNTC